MAVGDMLVKLTFKEKVTGQDLGWSETHYHVESENIVKVKNDLIRLARKRVKLLGIGVILEGLFVSNVGIWRDSGVDFFDPPRDTPFGPVYNEAFAANPPRMADFAHLAPLVRLQSGDPWMHRRAHWLSGAPDDAQVINERTPVWLAQWNTAWLIYSQELAPDDGDGLWGFRVKSRVQAEVFEAKINTIDPTTGVLGVRGAAPGLAVGKQVVIRNVRGFTPRIAGIYRIKARTDAGGVAAITLYRVGTAGGGLPLNGTYGKSGAIRLLKWAPASYVKAALQRIGNKRRAGPLAPHKSRKKAPTPVIR